MDEIAEAKTRVARECPGWRAHRTDRGKWWATAPGRVIPAQAFSSFYRTPDELITAIRAAEAERNIAT